MPILETLKTGTRDAHASIERAVPLLRPGGLTLDGYRTYLGQLIGFYEPVEAALAAHDWASAGVDFNVRRKTPLLTADLRSLGLDAAALAALPRCVSVPALPALPEALGCAYVFEGATRGGRVLGRIIGEALGLTRARGCAFFLAYGDDSDAMWRTFGAAIETSVRDDAAGARVLAAALDTFSSLQRWIEAAPRAV